MHTASTHAPRFASASPTAPCLRPSPSTVAPATTTHSFPHASPYLPHAVPDHLVLWSSPSPLRRASGVPQPPLSFPSPPLSLPCSPPTAIRVLPVSAELLAAAFCTAVEPPPAPSSSPSVSQGPRVSHAHLPTLWSPIEHHRQFQPPPPLLSSLLPVVSSSLATGEVSNKLLVTSSSRQYPRRQPTPHQLLATIGP